MANEVLGEVSRLDNVFHNLAERWHVSPRDFVWRGYDSTEFTVNDRGEALAALRGLEQTFTALRSRAEEVAAALGLQQPGSWGACRELAELGLHLVRAPWIDSIWLDQPAEVLGSAVVEARGAYDGLAAARAAYESEMPARPVDDFAPDIHDRLRAARDAVKQSCGWTEAYDSDLGGLARAVRATVELPELIAAAERRADEVREPLGQPPGDLDAARVERLVDLARIAFSSEHRPERAWLVRAGLERAVRALDAIRDDLLRYQELRAELLTAYTPGCLDLDAAAVAERFSTKYTSVLSKLSASYRADARALKDVRKDGNLPADPVSDLQRIAEAREIGARIDAASESAKIALGSYFAGRDTDPAATAAAIDVARSIIELASPDTDLRRLGDAVAVGSTPDAGLAQASERLEAAFSALEQRVAELEDFVESPSDTQAQTLAEISATVVRVAEPLRRLHELTSDLDVGAGRTARSIIDVQQRAELIAEVHARTDYISCKNDEWKRIIGQAFAGVDTNWDSIQRAADWLSSLSRLATRGVTREIRHQLLSAARQWPDVKALDDAVNDADDALRALTTLFEPARAHELGETFRRRSFDQAMELRQALADRVDELHDWTEWCRWRAHADADGWGEFVEHLVDAGVQGDEVHGAFRRAFWSRRVEAFFEEDPEEAEDLRGASFQRWVDEFRNLDRRLVRTGAERLIARREQSRKAHVAAPGGEVELLRREARKRRRHLPVRVLLSRVPGLLSDLKPCLMMSPLTVSHFLAPDHVFDLVIFDEASQVPPQDAINCIYRGDQVIIAGDSRQLPPTAFFQVAEVDELSPDEEEASTSEDMESVLDAAEALLPTYSLRWHYRSRSESLIAFSNRHMYDGSLVTFPSPEYNSDRLGIGFVYVPDGVYDRGKTAINRPEARVVAQRVAHYLTDGTDRSVGVIAFNTAQAQAIAEELDLLKAERPELEVRSRGDRLGAVFVKHLESVQGDERDVIIFSVGYGRDYSGRFLMNFGPLSRKGGQRRLNVAITRAREKVEVVASVRASDFQLSDGASAGARMLHDYIAYAEAGGRLHREDAGDGSLGGTQGLTPLEQQVAEEVSRLGYAPVPNIGVGEFRLDLGVKAPHAPDRYLLGIECDGDAYARTPTARDRERLRHEVLASLGWGPIHRIWSLDWVRNRRAEVDRLAAALREAERLLHENARGAGPASGVPQPPATVEPTPRERVAVEVVELSGAGAAGSLPWTRVYERKRLGKASSIAQFPASENRRRQADMIVELVEVEAPIQIDHAIRRVAAAWGISRLGHRVVSAGRQAITQAARRKAVEVRGDFLWKPGQALTYVRIPNPSDPLTRREIEEIAPEEIDLAIARLIEASGGLSDDQLVSHVARVFGFERTGGRIHAVVSERLRHVRATRPSQPTG